MKASLRLAAVLRNRIAAGELVAGDALPVESELEERYGLSKPVVREALRILETEGLVEVRRGLGGGPRVRYPSISEAAAGIGVYLKIGDVAMTDLLDTRDRLIASSIERLATRHDEVDLEPLAAAVQHLGDLVGMVEGFYIPMIEVGDVAVELGGNEVDRVLVASLRPLIAAELEDATSRALDRDEAVTAERDVADAWAKVLRNVRAGHGKAARLAFEQSSDYIRGGLDRVAPGLTVGDLFRLALANEPAPS